MTILTVAQNTPTLEMQIWVLTGLIGFLTTVIIAVSGFMGNALVKRLDTFGDKLDAHSTELIQIFSQNKNSNEKITKIEQDVAENSKEINALKLNCAGNNHLRKGK